MRCEEKWPINVWFEDQTGWETGRQRPLLDSEKIGLISVKNRWSQRSDTIRTHQSVQ